MDDSLQPEEFEAEIKRAKLQIAGKQLKLQGLQRDLDSYTSSLNSLGHASASDSDVSHWLSVFWLGFSPLYWPDMENFANPN